MARLGHLCLLLGYALFLSGCAARIEEFEGNAILAERFELSEGIDMEEPLADTQAVLTELFGTPDEPKWPEFLPANLIDIDRVRERIAGPQRSDQTGTHYGLYREHCIVCHGTAGDGMGPAAALLNPYPRDFRMGKFKFKSTPPGERPTRLDLRNTLRRGVVGSSMPAFDLVKEEDLEGLVDYVIYLGVRGELERKLLMRAGLVLDVDGGERLYDPRLANVDPDAFEESQSWIEEAAIDIALEWKQAESVVPELPEDFPWFGSEVDADSIKASVAEGQSLFRGNIAACAFCHGPDARGDGQQNNYDDWTRDWTVAAGLNPKEPEQLKPLLKLGALKPRVIAPRNLRLGAFRGGDKPQDLYLRIIHGIEGTPMPAVPLKPDNAQGLTETQVWNIVNYLLSLQTAVEESL